MISRRNGLIGLFGLLFVVGMIWAVSFLANLDSCMTGTSSGSCPTLADVNGVRYGVAVAHELVDIEADLTPFAPITRTNVPDYFAEMNVFQIRGIDPTYVLAAPATPVLDQDVGPYRLLYGPDSNRAFPALCDYIPIHLRQGDERCEAPA